MKFKAVGFTWCLRRAKTFRVLPMRETGEGATIWSWLFWRGYFYRNYR